MLKIFRKMLRIFWFVQKIQNLKINFFHSKWVKILVKIFKNEFFQKNLKIFWKMLRIFWFIQKIENLKINFFPYKMGQNTSKIEFFKNAQSSDLTRKLEIFMCKFKLTEKSRPSYFQGNSWKLGASIIQVIGKRQIYGLQFFVELLETGAINNSGYWKIAGLWPVIFRGTPGNWEHP